MWLALTLSVCATPASARGPASYPAPTAEQMVAVPGGNVYVRVNGNLSGPRPPVVLLHGGPGATHANMFDGLGLASDRAVILYDQLDSGRSDRPGVTANWTVARFVAELEAIRRALGIQRWHVVGHSWGGTIALEYAARHPETLASVVLAGPLISTKSWIADANVRRGELPPDVQTQLKRCEAAVPPPAANCEAATAAFYAAFNRREVESDGILAAKRAGLAFNPRVYEALWGKNEFVATGLLKDYDGEALLTRMPEGRTLFVVGQYDEARPETIGRFAARVPGAEFAVIPGAAHGIFSDRPAETNGLLRAWMERHDAP